MRNASRNVSETKVQHNKLSQPLGNGSEIEANNGALTFMASVRIWHGVLGCCGVCAVGGGDTVYSPNTWEASAQSRRAKSGSQFKSTSLSWCRRDGSRNARCLVAFPPQSGSRERCMLMINPVSLLIQPRTPAHGMVPPTCSVGLLS